MPVKLNGSTSGYVELTAPAVAGTTTLTLPTTTGTLVVANGGQTLEFAAGTVSLPSITTTGDTNTGIFFPAADTIAFTEGGTESFRIGSSGQLGVGGANYGTSGQVLTSGGASAAPSWANQNGMTLLGTITTTSGTSQTLSVTLTGYRFVVLMWNGVSASGNSASFGINDGTNTFAFMSTGSSSAASAYNLYATSWLNLTNGSVINSGRFDFSTDYGLGFADSGATSIGVKIAFGRTRVSTSTTTIDVRCVTGTAFDAGTVDVYGVK